LEEPSFIGRMTTRLSEDMAKGIATVYPSGVRLLHALNSFPVREGSTYASHRLGLG